MIKRKIVKIGKGSLGITLPIQLLRMLGLREGSVVVLTLTEENSIKIIPQGDRY